VGGLNAARSTRLRTQSGGFSLRAGLVKGFGSTLLVPAWGMQEGATTGTEYVYKSVDGGATWSHLVKMGDGLNNVTFVTASQWLQMSNDQSALETTDAGRTWHHYPSGYVDAAGVSSVFVFANELVGYGTVRGGIHRTVDGGLHWIIIETPGVFWPG
jgi:photosystem II stability/assembly factor-like uncharacterized protein